MKIIALDGVWRNAVNAYLRALWGGPVMVTRGEAYDTSQLPGFVAVEQGALYGAALYRIAGGDCEVSALLALIQGVGVSTRLLEAVKDAARAAGAGRLWLVTTNDNTHAIRFYQKRGFSLKAVRIGAFEEVRKIKGEQLALGEDGIPIEHEFEFEMKLGG